MKTQCLFKKYIRCFFMPGKSYFRTIKNLLEISDKNDIKMHTHQMFEKFLKKVLSRIVSSVSEGQG